MKIIYYFVFFLSGLVIVSGCDWVTKKETGCILGYYQFESLSAKVSQIEVEGQAYFSVNVSPEGAQLVASIYDTDDSMYRRLSEKYGDTNFQSVAPGASVTSRINLAITRAYPAENFVRISVLTKIAWDAEHPAGSSLDDVVRLVSRTIHPYIQNNYTGIIYADRTMSPYFYAIYPYYPESYTDPIPFFPIDGFLIDIKPEDLVLMGWGQAAYGGRLFHMLIPDTGIRPIELEVKAELELGKEYIIRLSAIAGSSLSET